MNAEIKRGSLEMAAAMLISGSIGWFVLMSGQPVVNVVHQPLVAPLAA
ncbi:hypothetical protein ISX56_26275, partial [Serratia ureilytica]|nr:hypothetical protein [Serratia ureilytica]